MLCPETAYETETTWNTSLDQLYFENVFIFLGEKMRS